MVRVRDLSWSCCDRATAGSAGRGVLEQCSQRGVVDGRDFASWESADRYFGSVQLFAVVERGESKQRSHLARPVARAGWIAAEFGALVRAVRRASTGDL